MFEQSLIFLDLETTGATAHFDRITEIGLVEVHRGRPLGEWSTLVNPQARIPPAIETLTGITNAMVASAPTFAEVAQDLYRRIEGKLLVAHNARFDYGFLRNEFRRAGRRYHSKVVCTVKLSRKLYPQHRRHNLDSLIERFGLDCTQRHRALGDARVLWQFLQQVYRERAPQEIRAAMEAQLKAPALPAGLTEDVLEDLPETPGVYLFYGENDIPLYVGKSVNLRSRVMSHFSGDHRVGKDMRISREISRVQWIETAGELGALMQEARLIKKLAPIHNRLLRSNGELCAYRFDPAQGDKTAPRLVYARDLDFGRPDHLYGLFRSRRDAVKALRAIADQHGLCPVLLGLERGSGPCFSHQLKKCRGACCGKEPVINHHMRLAAAFARLRVKTWPFPGRIGVRERSACGERTELHVLDRWCYLGTLRNEWELFDAAQLGSDAIFDLDTYRILTRFLESPRGRTEIVHLAGCGESGYSAAE